jgi:hypothetical protein
MVDMQRTGQFCGDPGVFIDDETRILGLSGP